MTGPELVCGPWAAVDDVPSTVRDDLPAGPEGDQILTDAIASASDILYVLSGRRWRGQGCTRTVTLEPTGSNPWAGLPLRRAAIDRLVTGRYRQAWPLWLPDWPVTAITTVTGPDGVLDPAGYRLVDGARLERLTDASDRIGWECVDWTVTYEHGQDPPIGGKRAAVALAAQLALALAGSKACRLPQRVQSITRQGTSIAVLDPMDFLDHGRTGLPDVDLWLSTVNPTGARRRASVITPDQRTHRPTYR